MSEAGKCNAIVQLEAVTGTAAETVGCVPQAASSWASEAAPVEVSSPGGEVRLSV